MKGVDRRVVASVPSFPVGERTYLWGYGNGPWGSSGARKTRAQIVVSSAFDHVDPEHMRRLFALADAIQDAGSDFGFGGGDREFAEQDAEFRRRHFIAPTGIWNYDGHWWQRYSWAAPYAPPGNSWHEALSGINGAMAVDAIGDHVMATPMCATFGLKNGIAGELWHYQPIETPNARKFNQVWGDLAAWPLPGDTPDPGEEPDMYQALPHSERAYDSRPGEQAGIDDTYVIANAGVTQTPLTPGIPRRVFIGLQKNAHVQITAIGTTPGWVKVAGIPVEPTTSVANYDADGVTNGGAPVGVPDGHIYLWTSVPGDVAVDVFARWD